VPAPTVSIETLQKNLLSDRYFRERRHPQWTDNYCLYRDTVIVNRLTQRQSVNVPLMKETIKTMLSRVDEPMDLDFEELDNDGAKELYINAFWDDVTQKNHLELQDTVDAKQVFLYGRTFRKLNILDGEFRIEVIDPQDVLVDRYVNPWDLESANHITHVGIYRTLAQVSMNPMYDGAALMRLKEFFATQQGLVKAGENSLIVADRNQRMQDMGVPDVENPIVGETYVELNETQIKVWHPDEMKLVVHVVVTANGTEILMDKPLRDILGVNFFTWTTWADDIERTDFWSDGIADIVRVPNQILNVYFSQLIENGILRGYGMHFYDATVPGHEGWSPVGYTPSPFGFYGLPGPPDKILQTIQIPELTSHMDEMQMMRTMVGTATAATPTESGGNQPDVKTLGALELMTEKAEERIKDLPKYARIHSSEMGDKFSKIVTSPLAAKLLKPVTLYKKGASGTYYEKTLKPSAFASKKGYKCKATQKSQQESDSLKEIQKLKIGAQQFPMNVPLQKILSDRMLSWLDLTPEEKKEVQDFQQQNPQSMLPQMPGMPGQGGPAGQPGPMPPGAGAPQMALPAPVAQPQPAYAQ
jgi:hypothetical protein